MRPRFMCLINVYIHLTTLLKGVFLDIVTHICKLPDWKLKEPKALNFVYIFQGSEIAWLTKRSH